MNHENHENHVGMDHSGHDMTGQNGHSMADMTHAASGHSGGHGVSILRSVFFQDDEFERFCQNSFETSLSYLTMTFIF